MKQLLRAQPRWLYLIAAPIAVLVVLNLILGLFLFIGGDDSQGVGALLRVFDVNSERWIPTGYSGALLILSSAMMFGIGGLVSDRWMAVRWRVLAAVFAVLAIDEMAAIHELTMEPIRETLGVGGFLYFAWVIPAAILVAVFAVAFLPFLRAQPIRLQRWLVLAAALYVGGALGLEMVGGWLFDLYGAGVATDVTALVEETLEMCGLIVLIVGLNEHRQRLLRVTADADAGDPRLTAG